MMDPVDGNAIAGHLFSAFGGEMTDAHGVCASCGTKAPLAELEVYMKAPGAVARCRFCGQVVIVIIERRDTIRVDLHGVKAFEMPK